MKPYFSGLIYLALILIMLFVSGCAQPGSKSVGTFVNPACLDPLPVDTNPAADDILVIGDSISLGYLPYVQANLAPQEVIHNPCNGQSTQYALHNVDSWMAMRPHYKAITFNQGLWDLSQAADESELVYQANLRVEIATLRAHTDHLIFFTTTYVPPGANGRTSGNELIYNQAAIEVMNEMGVPVYDLYAVSRTLDNEHVAPDDVHYTQIGYQALGDFVTQSIQYELSH